MPGKNVLGSLPEACDPSDPTYPLGIGGAGYAAKAAMLLICGEAAPGCEWFVPPAEPGTPPRHRREREAERTERELRRARSGASSTGSSAR